MDQNTQDSMQELSAPSLLSQLRETHLDTDTLFQKLSLRDYVLVWLFAHSRNNLDSSRVYLSDISKNLKLSTRETSKLVASLQKKGLVHWLSDEKGTYIQMSDEMTTAAKEQSALLRELYDSVISTYGREKFYSLLQEAAVLKDLTAKEIERRKEQSEEADS